MLQGLDVDSNAALALIYMRNDKLESPIKLQPSETDALAHLDSNIGGCVAALEALNGSLVQHLHANDESFWRYKHPTIGDAYAETLVQSPEMLGIYIRGSTPERVINKVTCGDVGIEKAVVVPKVLFPLMLSKLDKFSASKSYKSEWLATWQARSSLQEFLSHRCSKEFVSLYLEHHPDLLDRVSEPGLSLNAVPEVRLAVRLHEFGFLPEDKRKKFVETVSNYALDGQDTDALDDEGIQSLFRDNELEHLKESVRTQLLPRLGDVRRECESNHRADNEPEEHMQQLIESFETLKKCFGGDESATEIIDREIQRANEWIYENTQEAPKRGPRTLGDVAATNSPQSERSLFDDIDTDNDSENV